VPSSKCDGFISSTLQAASSQHYFLEGIALVQEGTPGALRARCTLESISR
jgi:hypothetical protein